jgi:NADP-dependent 3-hydroxy acid dehydrogenase YdfG
VELPALGLGVFQTPPDETRRAVAAAAYGNELQQLYSHAEVTAGDIAEIIGFVLSRPRHLAINEVLLRPAGQP